MHALVHFNLNSLSSNDLHVTNNETITPHEETMTKPTQTQRATQLYTVLFITGIIHYLFLVAVFFLNQNVCRYPGSMLPSN